MNPDNSLILYTDASMKAVGTLQVQDELIFLTFVTPQITGIHSFISNISYYINTTNDHLLQCIISLSLV